MKYGIIGTGAIGGYYGARLAYAGKDVHFLLHHDYEQVKEHGLYVKSYQGDFHLPHIHSYASTHDMPICDIVLVCLKTTNNHLLPSLLPPILHPDTLVVLIQNGIGVEEDVQKQFPLLQLTAGLAFICSAKTEAGVIHHQSYGQINLGNYSCRNQALIKSLLTDFQQAGIEAQEVEYTEARWKKAVWNMAFNGTTVVLDTQTDQLLKNQITYTLIKDLMLEVIHAAKACGAGNITDEFAQTMLDKTLKMPPYSPSMKLDYDFGRPMEIDYIYSRAIQMARKAGYPMNKMEVVEAALRYKELHQHLSSSPSK